MLQSDYNSNPYQCILYYCNSPVGQNDSTVYDTLLSNVCSLSYDINGDIVISGWLIVGYPAPSTATILSYNISDVLTFYNNFYTIPQMILAAQPYTMTTTDLNNVVAHPSMLGFLVFDSTAHMLKSWNGTTWIANSSLYLKLVGGTMTGDINLGSNNLVAVKTLTQSQPSCISIWTSANSSISFTANTPKVISLSSFAQTVNPNSDFSFNSSTGECKYTGSATKYFRVSVNYSMLSLAVASTQTNYISKNGSTSISGQRATNSYIVLGPLIVEAYSLEDIVQLSTNDTIQLGAQSSTTNSVSYSNISYAISQI